MISNVSFQVMFLNITNTTTYPTLLSCFIQSLLFSPGLLQSLSIRLPPHPSYNFHLIAFPIWQCWPLFRCLETVSDFPFGSWIKFKLPSILLTILDNSQWPWICPPVLKILFCTHADEWWYSWTLLRAHHLHCTFQGLACSQDSQGGSNSWGWGWGGGRVPEPWSTATPWRVVLSDGWAQWAAREFLPIYPDFNDSLPLATSQSICLSLTSKGQRHLNWKPLCSCLGATMPQAPQLSHTSTHPRGTIRGWGSLEAFLCLQNITAGKLTWGMADNKVIKPGKKF